MMNDRILELGRSAGLDLLTYYLDDDQFNNIQPRLEKFAELIVRECSGIAEGGWANPAHQIRQHFGVER